MNTNTGFFYGFLFPLLLVLLALEPAQAKYIGEDPPQQCQCESCNTYNQSASCCGGSGSCSISYSEGNLKDTYNGPRLQSSTGPTLDFNLTYNSYNADGSRAAIDTVMGYGWTNEYNNFLFTQGGHMYRFDGVGRVTTYKLGAGGIYKAAPGYFETLVKNSSTKFTLTQKDKTVFVYETVPNTPFMVGGPVFRLTSITDRNNNTTTLTYTNGKLTRITDTYGRSLMLGYNAQNKLATITEPAILPLPSLVTTLTYDSTGRKLIRITDPNGKFVQYSYNILYQITRKIDKDGRVFDYLYQNLKPVAIKDGAGNTLFSLSNPGNWATDSTALALDKKRVYIPTTTSKTDGRGNVWKYEYDSRGYITKITAPDGTVTLYTYDIGTPTNTLKLTSVTDANNHTTANQYDALGNLVKQADANGNEIRYEYSNPFSFVTKMSYFASGASTPHSVTTYDYDAVGNRIRETRDVGGLNLVSELTYDAKGNVTTEKDPNGHVTTYGYDAYGNQNVVTDPEGNVTRYEYDIIGNKTKMIDANGHIWLYDPYDGLNRLLAETDPLGFVTRYTYDGNGNRIQVSGNRSRKRPIPSKPHSTNTTCATAWSRKYAIRAG